MSMTLADWNAWPYEKRMFYVTLFTAYCIADDGILYRDVKKRRDLVRLCLEEQGKAGATQILSVSPSVNYVLTDGLQSDGKTLKKIEEIHTIKVLCSKRSEIGKEPSQHTLVGKFKSPEGTIREHFHLVIQQKMCNGAEVESRGIAEAAVLFPLGETNDLTFFSRCALHPDERAFLFEDPLFKQAVKAEAERLVALRKCFNYSVSYIEQLIVENIDEASRCVQNQQSLVGLSIP